MSSSPPEGCTGAFTPQARCLLKRQLDETERHSHANMQTLTRLHINKGFADAHKGLQLGSILQKLTGTLPMVRTSPNALLQEGTAKAGVHILRNVRKIETADANSIQELHMRFANLGRVQRVESIARDEIRSICGFEVAGPLTANAQFEGVQCCLERKAAVVMFRAFSVHDLTALLLAVQVAFHEQQVLSFAKCAASTSSPCMFPVFFQILGKGMHGLRSLSFWRSWL